MRLKRLLFVLWLLAPVVVGILLSDQIRTLPQRVLVASHFGISGSIAQNDSETSLRSAIDQLPPESNRLRMPLKLKLAQVLNSKGDFEESTQLLDEIQQELTRMPDESNEMLAREWREVFASTEYQMAWAMRRNGQSETEWKPILESSRQSFRHLAETSRLADDKFRNTINTQSAIRLARLDDSEVLPLPYHDAPNLPRAKGRPIPGKSSEPQKTVDQPGIVAQHMKIEPDNTGH